MNVQFFDHAHHKLKIRGLQSPVDVLTFEGREQLSTPFRYDIQFTSSHRAGVGADAGWRIQPDGTAGTGNAGTDCPAHPARRHYRL